MIIAISTCPRDGVEYFSETARLVARQANGREIYAYNDSENKGSAVALWELFQRLPVDDDILLLEDDVTPCHNAIEAIDCLPWPKDCELLSFFHPGQRRAMKHGQVLVRHDRGTVDPITSIRYDAYKDATGIHMSPVGPGFGYAQALKIGKRLAKRLHESKMIERQYMRYEDWPTDDELCTPAAGQYMLPRSIRDNAIGYFAQQVSKWTGLVIPAWFQHRGTVSAVLTVQSPHRVLVSQNWHGEKHDALTDDVSKLWWPTNESG